MKIDDWELNKVYEHYKANGSYTYAYFVSKLINNKSKAFDAIRSLIEFYRKNGLDEMLLGDVESPANWGIAIRDNEKVLVIIDAGLADDVWQKHY